MKAEIRASMATEWQRVTPRYMAFRALRPAANEVNRNRFTPSSITSPSLTRACRMR